MAPKSIQKNAVLSSIKTVLSLLIPLITFPYITRVLQVEAIGKHNFAVSVVGYFLLLADLGIVVYAIREGTKLRDDRQEISRFASEMLVIHMISAGISLVLLFCAATFVPKLSDYKLLILILSGQILLSVFSRSWIYNVYEDFGFITLMQALFQILSVVALLLFVRSSKDLYLYTVTYLISVSGANLVYGLRSSVYVDLKPVAFSALKGHIKPILIIFASSLTITIYVHSDVTILGWLVGDEAVGLYSTSVKVYGIVKNVIAAIITVTIPRLTQYAGTAAFRPFFHKLFKALALMILPAVTGLFLLRENVIRIIAGPEYIAAASSLGFLSIAMGASLFATLYANGVLIPYSKEKAFLFATLVSATVNIVLNCLLIPRFQQNAAAFTTLIAEVVVLLICYLHARKDAPLKGLGSSLLKVLVGCGAIAAVCLGIQMLHLSLCWETIVCIGASVIVYSAVQLLFKNEVFMQLFRSAFRFIKKKQG